MDLVVTTVKPNERAAIDTIWHVFESLFPEEARHIIQERTHIAVTDDFLGKLRELSSQDEIDQFKTYGWPTELNAITIFSLDDECEFTILMKRDCFSNDAYRHTIPHELAHVSDYCFLFEKFGNLYAASEQKKAEHHFWAYYNWSEFHAKAIGTKFYAAIKGFENSGEWPKDGIFRFAYVDYHTKSLIDKLEKFKQSWSSRLQDTNKRFWDFMQEYAGYLGRMSVLLNSTGNVLKDKDFPEEELTRILGGQILDLFQILLDMTTAEKALTRLKDLNDIIEAVCTHLNIRQVFDNPWM